MLDKAINEIQADPYDFVLVGNDKEGKNSIIRFSINKFKSTDEDDEDIDKNHIVPQIPSQI